MSASTASAAVPEPNDTPGTTPPNTPAPGILTSMLTPVAPARSAAFTLDQQATDGAPATGAALSSEGVCSDAFHGDGNTQQDAKDTGNGTGPGKQSQSVWRAWMLAGAARWARGGGTQNKRLDMKKARAMAHQVKEARTVNSGSVGTGSGGGRGNNASGAGGGKSLNDKAPKHGAGGGSKGPKNSTGPTNSSGGTGRGPSGRDTNRSTDRSSTGPKPGAGNSGKGGTPPNVKPGADTPNKSPKTSKDTSSSTTPKPSKDTKANAGPQPKTGPSGTAGAPGAAGTSGGASGNVGNTGKSDKLAKSTDTPQNTKPQARKDNDTSPKTPTSGTDTSPKNTTGTEDKKQPKLSLLKRKKTPPQPTASEKQAAASSDKTEKAGKSDTPTADKQPTETPEKTEKADSPAKPTTPPADKGKPFTTRPARETGYRDGTRAAQAAAHIKAYKDGARDGWTDTTEAAAREKARLDQAHADRKTARQETPVTLATSTDQPTTNDPTPIPVDHVSSTHVFLGEGAHQASMTRGEVRSLKGFERRLEEQATRLDARAEQTRGLKAHAEAQAKDAGRLLDAARSAEAGDKYIGTLTRLQEAAQTQATKAEEIYVRSLRGAEHCRTTLSNAQARYGGIYQAVIDSPETQPAELDFYKG